MEKPIGAFYWNELMTRDIERAKAFYAEVCGWSYEAMTMPEGVVYTVANAADEPVGGIFDMSGTEFDGAPEHWIGYVAVPDTDAAAAAAKAGGGKVEREPFDVPGVGRIAVLRDPDDAVIGVITPAPPPSADG